MVTALLNGGSKSARLRFFTIEAHTCDLSRINCLIPPAHTHTLTHPHIDPHSALHTASLHRPSLDRRILQMRHLRVRTDLLTPTPPTHMTPPIILMSAKHLSVTSASRQRVLQGSTAPNNESFKTHQLQRQPNRIRIHLHMHTHAGDTLRLTRMAPANSLEPGSG